jgi:hypothetical protein
VALVAATVVVANPLAPPSRDMQISTTQLSTSPGLLSPSDKSLLSALTPQLQPADIGPALAQILAALAADADRISREVNSQVGAEPQVAAAALPEQTANRTEPVASTFPESTNPPPGAATATSSFASSVVSSDVQAVLNGLVADTSYLSGKVVEAAYAVVNVIIRVPEFIVTAALDLLKGDLTAALSTVESAVQAFFGPGLIILNGIRDVLYGRQPLQVPPPTAVVQSLVPQSSAAQTDQSSFDSTPALPTGAIADSGRMHDVTPPAASLRTPSSTSKSAASSSSSSTSSASFASPSASGQTTAGANPQSSSKPAGSTRSTAGSARGAKSAG